MTGHIQFGHEVAAARWDTGGSLWHLEVRGGGRPGRHLPGTLWPGFTWEFAWPTRRFDPSSYDIALL